MKPHFALVFYRKNLSLLIFLFIAISCFSQKNESKVSVGVSSDYSLMSFNNNFASTLHLYYDLYENVRLAPSFSYYYSQRNMRMRAFSFNFHYLMPQLAAKILPVMENQGVCLYPIAGFFISFSSGSKYCRDCVDSNFTPNFGFDFGVGAEYEIPTMLPLLRDMNMIFEMKHLIVDKYSRPSMTFGLLYNF